MAFFFILFSNCQSSAGQTKNLMGFVNSSIVSRSWLYVLTGAYPVGLGEQVQF